jgi:outer membrane protein assembly factor BamD (BamD/ComL family)
MDQDPLGTWVVAGRLAVGRALLNAGRWEEAFEEVAGVAAAAPDGGSMAAQARELQHEAARRLASQSLSRSLKLFEQLNKTATTGEHRALILKEKADVTLAAGRYLDAADRYQEAIESHPHSGWIPYWKLKRAECTWRLARWLGLGTQHFEEAEEAYEGFVAQFPNHESTRGAQEALAEVRLSLAAVNRRIVRQYVDKEEKPWAAVPYLHHMQAKFEDLPDSQWAADELARITASAKAPLPGRLRTLELPGVLTGDQEQQSETAD